MIDAWAMAAKEKDFHLRDLYNSIANGEAPEWRLEMQLMPSRMRRTIASILST
jgi:catalase